MKKCYHNIIRCNCAQFYRSRLPNFFSVNDIHLKNTFKMAERARPPLDRSVHFFGFAIDHWPHMQDSYRKENFNYTRRKLCPACFHVYYLLRFDAATMEKLAHVGSKLAYPRETKIFHTMFTARRM